LYIKPAWLQNSLPHFEGKRRAGAERGEGRGIGGEGEEKGPPVIPAHMVPQLL